MVREGEQPMHSTSLLAPDSLALLLARTVAQVEGRTVRLVVEEHRATVEVAGHADSGEPEEFAAARRLGILLFDDLDERVLRLLCAEPTLTRTEIAGRLHIAADGALKDQLAILARRKVLVGNANGYTLHLPPGVVWQDRAKDLLAYLDDPEGRTAASQPGTGSRTGPRMPWPESVVLDATDAAAVRLLCASPQLSRPELAERLGVAPDSQLKEQLTRLTRCRILVSSSNGYSLACPEGAHWTDFRAVVLAYLDRCHPETPAAVEGATPRPSRSNGQAHRGTVDADLAARIATARQQKAAGEQVTGEPATANGKH
jgi:hypothetical protein